MATLRIRLIGEPWNIGQARDRLEHLEDVIGVEEIDAPESLFSIDDSSSAGLAENVSADAAHLWIQVTSPDEIDKVLLLAESIVDEAGLVMERVETA